MEWTHEQQLIIGFATTLEAKDAAPIPVRNVNYILGTIYINNSFENINVQLYYKYL